MKIGPGCANVRFQYIKESGVIIVADENEVIVLDDRYEQDEADEDVDNSRDIKRRRVETEEEEATKAGYCVVM